ncbi:hypothetical protein IscW_ISCW020451 [Ixodes scapularis]|uniref:Uncharacterized protein n=1 Tax=Ixodes scapularis TaxID=6945 RepID=B7Q137_IXOSC|nr:hypothetical protein IscW_ISCW020451 [Ixodes scapularis]|eukprot:XP_002408909.1 hypothetical protein IscW_ISCW020451 [Ixodes scapularis]
MAGRSRSTLFQMPPTSQSSFMKKLCSRTSDIAHCSEHACAKEENHLICVCVCHFSAKQSVSLFLPSTYEDVVHSQRDHRHKRACPPFSSDSSWHCLACCHLDPTCCRALLYI